jgi:hypothetical protein
LVKRIFVLFSIFFTQISFGNVLPRFEKGYRLPLELIIQDFTLLEKTPEALYLQKYIQRTNVKVDLTDAGEISTSIVTVSSCLGIDPWILTGLIQKESSFNKIATSPTGAAGLTQFTKIGIKEVNDQLGYRGKVGAPEPVTDYLVSQIRTCVNADWKDFWTRLAVDDTQPEFYPLLKEEMKKDILGAVLYGGILLKVYLGVIASRNNFEVTPISPTDAYYQALQMYNGEEGENRIKYAKNVFLNVQAVYPDQITFPY